MQFLAFMADSSFLALRNQLPLPPRRCTRLLAGSLLAAALALPGCSLELDDLADETSSGDDDGDGGFVIGAEASVSGLLKTLFPDLSDEEIADLSITLDLDDLMRLMEELERARKAAAEFSAELFTTAEERAATRESELANQNQGYPEGVEALGTTCLYDASSGEAQLLLSGAFDGQAALALTEGQVSVRVDGALQSGQLSCLHQDETVDLVFLIDITGSMSNVISSVRDSVVRFVDAVEESGVRGTISVVTFQDSVGVNTTFQEPAPEGLEFGAFERSPFFEPVDLDDADAVEEARGFVNRLEANLGADAPENLSGAIDFARNNVIGGSAAEPNVIDGVDDPPYTASFPELSSDRQVFIALTDVTFHGDDRTSKNSSLQDAFVPRDAETILGSLRQTGTVVHVVDPSWVDASLDPKAGRDVDADYWAVETGGLGEDTASGYSLVDLELVVVSEETGLLDVALDGIVSSSCRFTFETDLSETAEVELELDVGGELSTQLVAVTSY